MQMSQSTSIRSANRADLKTSREDCSCRQAAATSEVLKTAG